MFIPLKDENPTSRVPVVTVLLIGLNAVIFFYQLFSPEGLQYFVYKMGAIPYEITHFKALSLVIMESREPLARLSPPLTLIVSMFKWIFEAEKHLLAKFRDDYRRYMEKVPRLNLVLGIMRMLS